MLIITILLSKILKIHKQIVNPRKRFIIGLWKRKCYKIQKQFKVEIEDGREAS